MRPRVLICGLGSIGRRHARNLKQLDPGSHLSLCRHSSTAPMPDDYADLFGEVFFDLEAALGKKPDAAIICSPASSHAGMLRACASHGVHAFVEKPLADRTDGVREILETFRAKKLVLMVGYTLRFYRPLQIMQKAIHDGAIGRPLGLRATVGQYLPDWRKGVDYRRSVTARAELGGGALLELSHELDFARWLMGEVDSIAAVTGRCSDLEIDVEDTAEILLRFRSGASGNIHLDLCDRAADRGCRVVGAEGTITWDNATNRVQLFRAGAEKWEELHAATELNRNEAYVEELKHFFSCVSAGKNPAVDGDDGYRALQLVMAAKESAATGALQPCT